MVNGGIQSLTPSPHHHPEPDRKPNQPTCSQCAGLEDGSLEQQVKAIPAPSALPAAGMFPGGRGKMRRGQLASLECKQTMKLVRDWLRSLLLMMEGVYDMEIKITQLSCLLGRQWLIRCLTAHGLLIIEQSSPSDCKPQP